MSTRAGARGRRPQLAGVVEFPGETPVIVAIATSQGETTLALGPDHRVRPEPDFFAEVKSLLGKQRWPDGGWAVGAPLLR